MENGKCYITYVAVINFCLTGLIYRVEDPLIQSLHFRDKKTKQNLEKLSVLLHLSNRHLSIVVKLVTRNSSQILRPGALSDTSFCDCHTFITGRSVYPSELFTESFSKSKAFFPIVQGKILLVCCMSLKCQLLAFLKMEAFPKILKYENLANTTYQGSGNSFLSRSSKYHARIFNLTALFLRHLCPQFHIFVGYALVVLSC